MNLRFYIALLCVCCWWLSVDLSATGQITRITDAGDKFSLYPVELGDRVVDTSGVVEIFIGNPPRLSSAASTAPYIYDRNSYGVGGNYTFSEFYGGKRAYRLLAAQALDSASQTGVVYWDRVNRKWIIGNNQSSGEIYWQSGEDREFPWDVVNWNAGANATGNPSALLLVRKDGVTVAADWLAISDVTATLQAFAANPLSYPEYDSVQWASTLDWTDLGDASDITASFSSAENRLDTLEQLEFPSPADSEFKARIERGIINRLNKTPIARTTTYYVSNDGSDANAGTEAAPWQTLSKVQSVIDEVSFNGDVAFLFKGDDEWRELVYLNDGGHPVTFGRYGKGDKPFINYFTLQYLDADNEWTAVSGDQYKVSEATEVAILRRRAKADRLDALEQVDSVANCLSTSDSFYYDVGTDELYVNLDGDDPNSIDMEAAPSQYTSTGGNSGITISGQGSRVDSIEIHGAGVDRSTTVTQNEAFKSIATGDTFVAFTNCVGYYGTTHVFGHWAQTNSGGNALFMNCRAGLTRNLSGGSTVFNAYSRDGGNSAWYINCVVTHGARAATGSTTQPDTGFYTHTGGADLKDFIVYKCRTENVRLGYATDTPAADDLSKAKGLFVSCVSRNLTNDFDPFPNIGGMAFINCIFESTPPNVSPNTLSTNAFNGYVVNCLYIFDLSNYPSSRFSLTNDNGSVVSTGNIINSAFVFLNVGSVEPRLEYTNNWCAVGQDVRFYNNVFQCTGSSDLDLGYLTTSTTWSNNAFINVSSGDEARDPNAVTSASDLLDEDALLAGNTFGAPAAALKRSGSFEYVPPYDIFWGSRDMSMPTIGCIEY